MLQASRLQTTLLRRPLPYTHPLRPRRSRIPLAFRSNSHAFACTFTFQHELSPNAHAHAHALPAFPLHPQLSEPKPQLQPTPSTPSASPAPVPVPALSTSVPAPAPSTPAPIPNPPSRRHRLRNGHLHRPRIRTHPFVFNRLFHRPNPDRLPRAPFSRNAAHEHQVLRRHPTGHYQRRAVGDLHFGRAGGGAQTGVGVCRPSDGGGGAFGEE